VSSARCGPPHNHTVRVIVRPPKPSDADGLARAARDLAEQYAGLRKPARENSVWLVAEVDGNAVGEAQATLNEAMAGATVQPQGDVGRRVY
jgi:hypothetical protein